MDKTYTLDLSTFSDELKLLLAFIGWDNDPELPAEYIREHPHLDWREFVELARYHRVYPIVYPCLKKLDADLVPAFVAEELNRDYNRNIFQMMHLIREMDLVTGELAKSDIRTLLLKGPVLADSLYGDLSQRTSKDLDILVEYGLVEAAVAVLERLGYIREEQTETTMESWKQRDHHISYYHQEKHVQIELHWRMNADSSAEPSFEELWSRSRISTLTATPIRYPGAEDLFYYLVSHGARHGWFRLRWLADIDRLIKTRLDWSRLIPFLQAYKTGLIGGQAIYLSAALFRTGTTEAMLPLVSGKRPERIAQLTLEFMKDREKPDPTSIPFLKYIFHFMTIGQKLKFVIIRFIPTPKDIKTLPLPKQLQFLYFPLRPILWCWRRVKQLASS